MACCNPLFMRFSQRQVNRYTFIHQPGAGYQIPCRQCLNCRVDNRNMWSDRAKYELCHRLTAAFVTLTYDDVHLYQHCMHYDYSQSGSPFIPSLEYKHVRRFINALRMRIKRANAAAGFSNERKNVLLQDDFSYIYVGEYGENGSVFDRPHFHVLFFGVDFAAVKQMAHELWPHGIIDVLPVLDGAINYVLKYMDKQVFGKYAEQKYDRHNLARPKRCASRSFGADLYKYVHDFAKEHNWCYKCGNGNLRPMPIYYRNKFTGTDIQRQAANNVDKFAGERQLRDDMRRIYHLKDCSVKAARIFKLKQSQIRERKLRQMILNDGVGVMDYVDDTFVGWYDPQYEKMKKLDPSVQQWLAGEFVESCLKDFDDIPFNRDLYAIQKQVKSLAVT